MIRHVLLAILLPVIGCGAGAGCGSDDPAAVRRLGVEVLGTRPHERTAFTQGLEIHDGQLFEGTGLNGSSAVTRTDLGTGRVTARSGLPAEFFGEGITVAGPILWQLTWKNAVAIARDPRTLDERGRVRYDGEGWGLCAQPERLVMSDGSATLTFRDRTTFAETGTVDVTEAGRPVTELNELECTPDGRVWANVWQTDRIVEIDPGSGAVVAVVDATGLLPDDQADGADVLNGIAAIPDTDEFLITGKLWPTTFRVRFTSAGPGG